MSINAILPFAGIPLFGRYSEVEVKTTPQEPTGIHPQSPFVTMGENDRLRIHELLRIAQKQGYVFKPAPLIEISSDNRLLALPELNDLLTGISSTQGQSFDVVESKYHDLFSRMINESYHAVSPDLHPNKGQVDLPTYALSTHVDESGMRYVSLSDYIGLFQTGQRTILEVPLDINDSEGILAIKQKIIEAISLGKYRYDSLVDRFEELKPTAETSNLPFLISVSQTKQITGEQRMTLEQIFTHPDAHIFLKVKADRMVEQDHIWGSHAEIELTREDFERNDFRAIEVNGNLESFIVRSTQPAEPLAPGVLGRHSECTYALSDNYHVTGMVQSIPGTHDDSVSIWIRYPENEGMAFVEYPVPYALPVNLQPLKLPGILNLDGVVQLSRNLYEGKFGPEESYPILSNLPSGVFQERYLEKIPFHAIATAEKSFGLPFGGAARGIYIEGTSYKSGYVFPMEGIVATSSGTLNKYSPAEVTAIFRHETAHIIYRKMCIDQHEVRSNIQEKWQTSYTSFNALFSGIRIRDYEFFKDISETGFFGFENAGHSEDSASELFASFVNSLFYPDWQTRLSALSEKRPSFRESYSDCLKTLGAILEDQGLDESTPIMAKIIERIQYLKN